MQGGKKYGGKGELGGGGGGGGGTPPGLNIREK